ncbi:uncharacterized protein LOC110115650 [Dendrobium catenatum]|uniref:Uncharacterized protein n=1 Tax=Dendrobium catenatum TaxID=906689 RepID=A0A2I0VSP1_9ASPA|nr:uncharacterized protein LOC110115650 [Dendrobium catenatum]PKU66426.1 hypothetical protein MA16_Dca009669 [Dendrobium catenatum]
MGCGGSKDEVAVGNTVAAKSLQLNNPLPSNTSLPPVDSAASETKEVVAAPLISKDSPDRYFSSRKDEEAIAAGNVLNKDDDHSLADSISEVEDSSVVKKVVVIVSDGEAKKLVAEGSGSQDEKTSAGGEDVKAEVVVAPFEEKASEDTVAEKKN